MDQSSVPRPLLKGGWLGGFPVLKQSIVDLFTNLVPFLVGLLAIVPVSVVVVLYLSIYSRGAVNPFSNVALMVVGIVGVLGLLYVGICLFAAMPLYGLARADGRKMTVKEMYKFRLLLALKLFVANILLVIPILIGLFLLIIPGIVAFFYLMPALFLMPYVIAEEGKGPWQGIKIAHKMGKSHRGKVYGIFGWYILLVILILVPVVLIIAATVSAVPHAHADSSTYGQSDTSSSNGGGGGGIGSGDPLASIAYAYLYRWIQAQAGASVESTG